MAIYGASSTKQTLKRTGLVLVSLAFAQAAFAQTVDVTGKWYGRINVSVDEQAIREKAGEKLDDRMIATLRTRIQEAKKILVILTLTKDGSFSAMIKNAPKGMTPVNTGKWTLKGSELTLTGYKSDSQRLTINTKTASLGSVVKTGAMTVTTVYTRR